MDQRRSPIRFSPFIKFDQEYPEAHLEKFRETKRIQNKRVKTEAIFKFLKHKKLMKPTRKANPMNANKQGKESKARNSYRGKVFSPQKTHHEERNEILI